MPLKEKTCKACRQKFFPSRHMQTACSPLCAMKVAEGKREKKAKAQAAQEKRQDKKRLQDLKPLSYWLKRAEKQVNRYIRLRDYGQPCISCGAPWKPEHQAGHYRSVGGFPELRFRLENINGQCIHCNMHLSGNPLGYRVGLAQKWGQAVLDELDGPHVPVKMTRQDCEQMEQEFKALADALAKRHQE